MGILMEISTTTLLGNLKTFKNNKIKFELGLEIPNSFRIFVSNKFQTTWFLDIYIWCRKDTLIKP
jgi:hypothetical protein